MRDMRLFTEIGIGNRHFISTEIEKGDCEKRRRGCVRMRVTGIYLRLWLGRTMYVLSTSGSKRKHKNTRRFKLVFGIEGVPRRA